MTIAEIATTGKVQVRRSRNDIKFSCHSEERALRPQDTSAGNFSPGVETPLEARAVNEFRVDCHYRQSASAPV